ncbi:MAG TPA: F0F1 ATP synthase subunit A, partial [Anaeromyxobacteraceae bacterium]|nr:F0F1 ATP synthase subunit A [Anaeromyxobacteraceae bacterium]
MNAVTLVSIALSLTIAQHEGQAAPQPAGSFHGGKYTAEQLQEHMAAQQAQGEHGAPAEGHGEAAEGHGAAEGAHGGGHGNPCVHHAEGLSGNLMHHVTDGYSIEIPGVCDKEGVPGFHWNCEWDLRKTFGTTQDPETCAVAGPLVFAGGKLDMTPSKHLIMMWLATAVLLVVLAASVGKRNVIPKGLYNFVELLVAFVRNEIAVKNIGEKDGDRFVPYLVTAFFFILFVNLFGLLPFAATATGNLAVTLTMALFTFFITQYAGIKSMGIVGFLSHLTGGVHPALWVIMIPVEILGLFTKPFALTVRLFANMIAGHIVILSLIGLIFALGSPFVAFGSVPMALAIFMLELFVGFVQAYIFTMLSAVFIGSGLAHHGHDDADHHE